MDDLSDMDPALLLENRLTTRLEDLLRRTQNIELFDVEARLEREGDSTTRVDLLGSMPGEPGIAIIELKKDRRTEREALTELLGYSQYFGALLPALAQEDILLVLVSPMQSRIVRDAYLQLLIFENRPIVALRPTWHEAERLESLRLVPWIPDRAHMRELTRVSFKAENFDVCKIVWHASQDWNEEGRDPSDFVRSKFDRVSAMAAQLMEAEGIHGFCFTSQLWSEIDLPYPNSLVIVGWNPYSIRKSVTEAQYMATEPKSDGAAPRDTILPEMEEKFIDRHFDVFDDLARTWSSHLFRIGMSTVETATGTTELEYLSSDQGFFTWDTYQDQRIEDVYCHSFAPRATGLIRELYWDVLKVDYDIAREFGVEEHPRHGDMFREVIETFGSQYFLRDFIERMLGDQDDDAVE